MRNKIEAMAGITAVNVEVLYKQIINTKAAEAIMDVLEQSLLRDADTQMIAAAQNIVVAIMKGDIPNIKITY